MDKKEILGMVDYTLLKQTSTWSQIEKLCSEALEYKTRTVCIPPYFVKKAHESFPDLTICTVIGFPNGYNTTAIKVEEAIEATLNGAKEIDMVINLGMVKEGKFDEVEKEISQIKEAIKTTLKVIIETCLLTEEEKVKLCKVVVDGGADFIKTSTGFSTAGATVEDVSLMSKNVDGKILVKAAGGINNFDDAEAMIKAGASRLGSSRLINCLKGEQK